MKKLIDFLPEPVRAWFARHRVTMAFIMVGFFAGAEMYMQLGGKLPGSDSVLLRAGVFGVVAIGGAYYRWKAMKGGGRGR